MDRVDVLDHGFVSLVEAWGSDEGIIKAARMSTGKGFLGWGPRDDQHSCMKGGRDLSDSDQCAACHQGPGDEKLLKFLYENKHSTPFEMAGATIEVQAPIFVFREWHRHRTQSYSEMSARYAPLPDVNYVPTIDRAMLGGGHLTKQAGSIKGSDDLTVDAAAALLAEERELHVKLEDFYQRKLKAGFPKELARTHLPVSRYSRMRASANLRNWLAFLTLRMAPTAQWEIRQYANAVGDIVKDKFPRTWELFAGTKT
jgi:thymidylate synthase (FAD)